MDQAYVVIGRRGEYSDAVEWPVRVFGDEAEAEAFAALAQAHVNEIEQDLKFRDRAFWSCTGVMDDRDAARLERYDTALVYRPETGPHAGRPTCGSWDGGEAPRYTVCGPLGVGPLPQRP